MSDVERIHRVDLNRVVSSLVEEAAKAPGRGGLLLRRQTLAPASLVEIPAAFLLRRPARIQNHVNVKRRLVDPHRQVRALGTEPIDDGAGDPPQKPPELGRGAVRKSP